MRSSGVLANKVALVTGAGRGIGRAVALHLASAGAQVALVSRTLTEIQEVAGEIAEASGAARAFACDITDPGAVAALPGRVAEALGEVQILVNNAGSAESHPFKDHPDELWHRMLAANLTGVYLVTKAFVPAMMGARWGRIVNIASTAARVGAPYVAAYTAAKHGVLGLTRALAAELNGYGITVNAVCPGFADTPLTQTSIERITARTGRSAEEARSALEQTSPQRRLIEPDEVASAVLFLTQESSKGITGQSIVVDGGGVMP